MKHIRRVTVWISLICLTMALWLPVRAESGTQDATDTNVPASPEQSTTSDAVPVGDYEAYLKAQESAVYPIGIWTFGADRIIAASKGVETQGTAEAMGANGQTEQRSPVCLFTENNTYAEWNVTVETAGYYHLAVSYCGLEGKQLDIESVLYINGVIPFETANRFLLPRSYAAVGGITQDALGNDVRPLSEEIIEWKEYALRDKDGVYSDPYVFYFHAGENRVRLEMTQANVAVETLVLYNKEALPTYEEYDQANRADSTKADTVAADAFLVLEGESPYRVTHTVLNAGYDRMSAITSPQHASKLRLNTIGANSWTMPGQAITWEVEITEPGYYELGMRARQNAVRGFFSTRRVYVDGELLFDEMKNVQVDYSSSWQIIMLGGDAPCRIYLPAGRHTVTLEAVGGVVGPSVKEFEDIIFDLNEMYRDMIMITGTSPDTYRDYKLEQEIPDLHARMRDLIARLRKAKATIESYNIERGGNAVTAERVAQQLESFIEKPRTVSQRISSFQDNISSLSGWVLSLKEQPLEVDYLFLKSPQAERPAAEAGFWSQLVFRWNSFLGSFVEDYSQLSEDTYGGDAIDVWVGLGRDQAQLVKDMVENSFIPQYGIPVNISLVQQGLVEAIAAGKGPDVMLYTDSSTPVNLAARNQLVDLSQCAGFDEVVDWFAQGALTPYTYNDGVYALPLQQSFSMLFCRTDILEEIGVEVPTTWTEFYDVMTKIQKKKLEVGIPAGSVTAPNIGMFSTLLYQHGGSYYNEDFSATAFDSEEALEAFKQWTEFYTKYGLDVEFDFYVRFRSGQMPMAIQDYTLYNTLAVAAPEIRGLWTMSPLPGTVSEDGTVNNAAVSGTTVCLMLQKAEDPDKAFAFMKWFASEEPQTEYGLAIENILGEGGRYNPANVQAFRNMNWSDDEMDKLYKQLTNSRFDPVIPATYYVTRNVTNAFRAVVVKGSVPREALNTYNQDINSEIQRKRQELGLE